MPTTKDVQPQSNVEPVPAGEIEAVRAKLAEFLSTAERTSDAPARPEPDGGPATGQLNGSGDHAGAPMPDPQHDGPATKVHRSAVKIKGRQGGVSLELGEGEWDELLRLLEERLVAAAGFFRGGQVVLAVGDRGLEIKQLRQVARLLEDHEMRLGVVRSTAGLTQQSALELGLAAISHDDEEHVPVESAPVRPSRPAAAQTPTAAVTAPEPPAAPQRPNHYVHRGSLRSGQVLRKTESIVVIGDVNPGAQVISGGDVMVWGRLRGVAHAGADGNDRAVVTALDFAPTQLRIAALTTISPESRRGFSLKFWKKEPPRRPESARILEGRIVVEPWDEAKPSAIAKWRG
jgi:septum site-determining protein MinC